MLINEGFWGCAVHSSHVEDYSRALKGGLTTRRHGHNIGGKSDKGQDAPSRVTMGNVGQVGRIQGR